jgi:hypothetical protein
LANFEKEIAEEIIRAGGHSAATLGLRFDKVVVRVLGRLRAFAEPAAPAGVSVVITLTAPIRLPAQTVGELEGEISALLAAGRGAPDVSAAVCGNGARLRRVDHLPARAPKLIGFVHNPGVDPARLLDLAERWLRGHSQA